MNSKERYEFMKQTLGEVYHKTEEDVITELVDRLIECLYRPVPHESMFVMSKERCEQFNIADEAINWGNLQCNEVKKFENGSFMVIIDEASPAGCPTFCQYIERYMKAWGWDCIVHTEW